MHYPVLVFHKNQSASSSSLYITDDMKSNEVKTEILQEYCNNKVLLGKTNVQLVSCKMNQSAEFQPIMNKSWEKSNFEVSSNPCFEIKEETYKILSHIKNNIATF